MDKDIYVWIHMQGTTTRSIFFRIELKVNILDLDVEMHSKNHTKMKRMTEKQLTKTNLSIKHVSILDLRARIDAARVRLEQAEGESLRSRITPVRKIWVRIDRKW